MMRGDMSTEFEIKSARVSLECAILRMQIAELEALRMMQRLQEAKINAERNIRESMERDRNRPWWKTMLGL